MEDNIQTTVVNQETLTETQTENVDVDVDVSTDIATTSNELPKTLEEYEIAKKAAVNKANTEILKALGVKSIKEFKEVQSKATEALTKFEELAKRNEELNKTYESVSHEYETLKQTSILDRLAVKPEYREDLVTLAKDKIDENNSFEKVLQEMVEGKYSYAINSRTPIKMGIEKTDKVDQESSISDSLAKKYPWLKG